MVEHKTAGTDNSVLFGWVIRLVVMCRVCKVPCAAQNAATVAQIGKDKMIVRQQQRCRRRACHILPQTGMR
jgi:hypothetical protein